MVWSFYEEALFVLVNKKTKKTNWEIPSIAADVAI